MNFETVMNAIFTVGSYSLIAYSVFLVAYPIIYVLTKSEDK